MSNYGRKHAQFCKYLKMKNLLAAIEKFDEDCKKRRKEHVKSFLDKYDRVIDDDEVLDLRTFQVVDKKDAQDKVIKFGELNTYSISFEGQKYVSVIKSCLRQYKGCFTVSQKIEEQELIEDDCSLPKIFKNRIDKLENLEKRESSEDEDPPMFNDSKNETLPLNNANTPYFRALCPRYIANGKIDCLLDPEIQKDRCFEYQTTQRKTKKQVPEICDSACNQRVRDSPELFALSKDVSNCSLTDKMATHKLFPKSSKRKIDDSNSRGEFLKNCGDEHINRKIPDSVNEKNMAKVVNPSIVKKISTKKKYVSKKLSHNLEINKKISDPISAEKTQAKGVENATDTTKPNKLLYDWPNLRDTVSLKSSSPPVDKSIPRNVQETPDIIPTIMKNFLPNKALSHPAMQYLKYVSCKTVNTETFCKSSESEISKNSLMPESIATFSSHVKLKKCYVRFQNITLTKNAPYFKNVKKQLTGRKMSIRHNCSPSEKGGNSEKADNLPTLLMSKRRVNKLFADSTTPASVDMPNNQSTPCTFNFKAFSDYTKLWYQKQKQSFENSQNCSYDSSPETDRVLRSKYRDSLYNRKDELINISGIPSKGFISPLTKRLKFAPNIPDDCLTA